MKKVKLVLIISLMAILNVTYAQPYGDGRGGRNNQHEFRDKGPAGLELSEEQRAKAATLINAKF